MANSKQQTESWFAQRVGMATGSRIPAILGLSKYSKPDDVLREMVREYHGAEREFTGNAATEYGIAHEDDAISDYEILMGLEVAEAGFVKHPEHDFMGASPDGFVGAKGLIEVKAPFTFRNMDTTPDAAEYLSNRPDYYAQIQLQLHCTKREWCDFVVWTPNGGVSRTEVAIDHDWLDKHLPHIVDFMGRFDLAANDAELSKQHLEPLVVDVKDKAALTLSAQLGEAIKAAEQAAAVVADLKEQLLAKVKHHGRTCRVGAMTVIRSIRKGSVDYRKAHKALGVDTDQLDQFRKKDTEIWSVRQSNGGK